jgi:hypothetical protein
LTAGSLNDLAYFLYDQGEFASARPLFERSLWICENVLGPEPPRTLRVRNDLAELRLAESARFKR